MSSPENLVVLGKPLWPAGGSRLDLTGAETHHQVSDEGVFCLAATMADHHTPAVGLGQLASEGRRVTKHTGLIFITIIRAIPYWNISSDIHTFSSLMSIHKKELYYVLLSRGVRASVRKSLKKSENGVLWRAKKSEIKIKTWTLTSLDVILSTVGR